MKILYGIQGTGNGHIARSRMMAKYLAESDVDVTYLFSGRPAERYFEMAVFGDYQCRRGLTFATQAGKINYLQTTFGNNLWQFAREVRELPVDDYDLIITDFEPVTAWAGKLARKPVLGIGHQYAFGKNTPLAGESWLAKKIMRHFAPADYSLGLHWAPYNDNVLPPIIDTSLSRQKCENFCLVYLPFEDQRQVTALLNQYPDYQFIQYSPELTDQQQGNVLCQQAAHQRFKEHLARASGVICSSGFELVSECLHLGLPILTKPTQGQMEQHSNALALQQLKKATVMQSLDNASIRRWLAQLSVNDKRVASAIPDVAPHVVNWILAGEWQSYRALTELLWKQNKPSE
ncbi:MJ1255/VC2487 family glycosyltransferase [Thalassotalea mangrovi]|uniref:Glycosyltransferase n=1 Tax=Thalassotalea mangrovi TaxID=2572245 RepID=A0A4U1B594_9GAMM|nr:MJ1255/VC2487 family glycosyltransferase [Thalassotalea mangrovi]TKB44708.1 hypothetical protein E8M12_11285 [Thalassotalea mangrovi]